MQSSGPSVGSENLSDEIEGNRTKPKFIARLVVATKQFTDKGSHRPCFGHQFALERNEEGGK
jgi:hypothetical protein